MYSWGDEGTGGEYELYGGGNTASGDQVDHPLSDAMVMRASACKSAMAHPLQIEAWFKETEPWLVETTDFPWWPQLLPLAMGQDKVADENARKLAASPHGIVEMGQTATGSWELPPSAVDLPLGSISR